MADTGCGCNYCLKEREIWRGREAIKDRLRDNELEPAAEQVKDDAAAETVNHPAHYNQHPSGIECIIIVEHFSFCTGNAIKYAWRAGLKTNDPIQDLEKARWYIDREIRRLKGQQDGLWRQARCRAAGKRRSDAA